MQNQLFPLNRIYSFALGLQPESKPTSSHSKEKNETKYPNKTYLLNKKHKPLQFLQALCSEHHSCPPFLPHTMGLQGNRTSRQQQHTCERVTGQTGRRRRGSLQSSEYLQTNAGSNPPAGAGMYSPAAASTKGPIPGASWESAALLLPLPFSGRLPAKHRCGTRATKPQRRCWKHARPSGQSRYWQNEEVGLSSPLLAAERVSKE